MRTRAEIVQDGVNIGQLGNVVDFNCVLFQSMCEILLDLRDQNARIIELLERNNPSPARDDKYSAIELARAMAKAEREARDA